MKRRILVLEDDHDRVRGFRSVLGGGVALEVFRTALGFLGAWGRRTRDPHLICLDHDLFPDREDDPDPGDGRQVAGALAREPPCAPVLIHSSNRPAAAGMFHLLRGEG